jgi:DNA-binding NarL/FixJ family response regulator
MVGELIRRLLADEPCTELHFCQSSWDAIKMAKEIRPTIILQDLVMPDVNGLTMLRRYRITPETKDTPVIILTPKKIRYSFRMSLKPARMIISSKCPPVTIWWPASENMPDSARCRHWTSIQNSSLNS